MTEKSFADVTGREGLETKDSFAGPTPSSEGDQKPSLSWRLKWKRDLYVLGPLTVLYVFCFLDRTNIGSAVVFGLAEDLNLTGTEYNSALVCFFVPYVLFDIPANILLLRLKPHIWCESAPPLVANTSPCSPK